MSKRTNGRIARDDAARKAAGGARVLNAAQQRELASRSWYELKRVHERSGSNIAKVAGLLAQYNDPLVLMKLVENGDKPEFEKIHSSVPELMIPISAEFNRLWLEHAHRKGQATSVSDMEKAVQLFDGYQNFDLSLLETFQPLITKLNTIYNKAMLELEEARLKVAEQQEADQPTTVDFKEVQPA